VSMGQVFCVLIPITIITIALPKVAAGNNRMVKYNKWVIWCVFLAYCLGNLYFTLLTRQPGTEFSTELTPFRSYSRLFEPFYKGVNYPSSFVKAFLYNVPPFASIILNILLYYPLGYLLPILFPKLKKDSAVMNAIVMNMVANLLGMGNAATPLGIAAMKELDKENRHRGSASNEMCMFVVINTASIQLIPSTVIGLRQMFGSQNPSEIIVPVWVCSVCAVIMGVCVAKVLEKRRKLL